MDYMTTSEAAKKWGITQRRVQILCSQGRIQGAIRLSVLWAIPTNTKKPEDRRIQKSVNENT